MTKDLVCGMKIEESTAAAKTVYKGIIYYFCAHGCLRAFLQEPEKYLNVGLVSDPTSKLFESGNLTYKNKLK